jgi:glycosyl transferase family 25
MNVYIISVANALERRAHVYAVKTVLEARGFIVHIVDGYYYKNVDVMNVLQSEGIAYTAPNYSVSLSQIGCFLSHRAAWKLIAAGDSNAKHFVLEDDMSPLDTCTPENLGAVLESVPSYDMIHLWKHPAQAHERHKHTVNAFVSHMYSSWGACAYTLTPSAAKTMVEGIHEINVPVDNMFIRDWYPKFNAYMSLEDYFVNMGSLGTGHNDNDIYKSLIWSS